MFFDDDRILAVREMILRSDEAGRRAPTTTTRNRALAAANNHFTPFV
jgi:hypothetical protein